MSISSWFPWKLGRQHKGRSRTPRILALRRHGTRLAVEQLEDRSVPATYTAATVPELIDAINLANSTAVADTIQLVAGSTFSLTQVNNTTNGPNGLPVIAAAGGPLTILGNGDTIARTGSKAFRLLHVAPGASLALENLTLTGGLAKTNDSNGEGGAIYNDRGALTLRGVTVTGNSAVGSGYFYDEVAGGGRNKWVYRPVRGNAGQGGGIYSCRGTLTLTDGTQITNNSAVGFNNGFGYGGGVYVYFGVATLTNVTVSSNRAVGGDSGQAGPFGGGALAGGVYLNGSHDTETATLTDVTFSSNVAIGGNGKSTRSEGGNASGGAMYVSGFTAALTRVTMSSNAAMSGTGTAGGGWARAGAIGVSGSTVTMKGVTLSSNAAIGGSGGTWGGNAQGGALEVGSSRVSMIDSTLSSNRAVGGDAQAGGYGGTAYGGAILGSSGNFYEHFSVRGTSITGNSAQGGTAGSNIGAAQGGGIYGYDVYLDAFTLVNTIGNTPDEIYGSYILMPNVNPLSVTPASLDFGTVAIGGPSSIRYVTLTNTGTVPITTDYVTITESAFHFAGLNPTVILPGDSLELVLWFSPMISGLNSATLSISIDVWDSPVTVNLFGIGEW